MEGRSEAPSAAIIDSQSFKTTESGGPRCYYAGKKIKGRKRHIATDTAGNILEAIVQEADIQDRDGAPMVIESVRQTYPSLINLFADCGFAGEKLSAAIAHIEGLAIAIVKRSDTLKGFVVLPKRRVVERSFAWPNRCRRLAKDWEATIASSEGMATARIDPPYGSRGRSCLKNQVHNYESDSKIRLNRWLSLSR